MDSNKKEDNSRRDFLKKSILSVGAIGALGTNGFGLELENNVSESGPVLSITGYPVNRVHGLMNGSAKIKGFNHVFKKGSIGDINTNVFSGSQDFDIAEIGLHPYMLAYANEGFRDFSLLPIFPLRLFRHKSVFIRTDRGIKTPKDLIGKTIGTAGYSSTSLTWLRGLFKDEYGISPTDVNWVVSNKDSSVSTAGNISIQEKIIPEGISIKSGTPGMDESELLVSGEVDALFHAAEPIAFTEGSPLVDRLFSDSRKVEQEYYSKTGIFPIMHAVAIRNSLVEANPELPKAVFDAYNMAKAMDFKMMNKISWAFDSLPWYKQEMEATIKVMGKDYWPYGIEKNKKALEALFRYSYEQGLASKQLMIEDVFHKSALSF